MNSLTRVQKDRVMTAEGHVVSMVGVSCVAVYSCIYFNLLL